MLSTELAVALAAAVVAVIGGGVTHLLVSRRGERARARGFALLVKEELAAMVSRAESAKDAGRMSPGDAPLTSPTWQAHAGTIAAELTPEEVMALNRAFEWVAAANAQASETPPRSGADLTEAMELLIPVLLLASSALDFVVQRRGGLLRARKTQEALPPNPTSPCECGHVWWDHHWRTRRRRIRTSRFRVAFADVAAGCSVCDCGKFRYAGDSTRLMRALRRLRLAPQAPYDRPGRE